MFWWTLCSDGISMKLLLASRACLANVFFCAACDKNNFSFPFLYRSLFWSWRKTPLKLSHMSCAQAAMSKRMNVASSNQRFNITCLAASQNVMFVVEIGNLAKRERFFGDEDTQSEWRKLIADSAMWKQLNVKPMMYSTNQRNVFLLIELMACHSVLNWRLRHRLVDGINYGIMRH